MTKLIEKKEVDAPFTKSTTFVRPMLGYSSDFYGKENIFYNCYINVNPDKIYLVFNKPLAENFMLYTIGALREHVNFTEIIDVDNYYIMSFNVPNLFKKDFYTYLDGKYSKLSSYYKTELLNAHSLLPDTTENLKIILYPQKHHRYTLEEKLDVKLDKDAEVFDRMDWDNELFDVTNF